MAFPTSVNSQITDSVTQANVKVLGDAPAMAVGNLYQATSQALSNAAHNATTSQQQTTVTAQAATTMGVSTLYAIDTAATAIATAATITNATVEGHIYSKIASPVGKKELEKAVTQANDCNNGGSQETLNTAHEAICDAIKTAMDNNVSKQSISYVLHEVMHDKGLSMLYPFAIDKKPITSSDIEAYYQAIIDASD